MFNLAATDVLEAIASVDAVIKFTLSGHAESGALISKEGNVGNGDTELYTAVGADRIYSVTFFNSHSSAVTVTLNKDPTNVGTLYPIFSISLGVGYTLLTDGIRLRVTNTLGAVVTSFSFDLINDTTPQLGGDLDTNVKNIKFDYGLSSNDTYNGLIASVIVGEDVVFPEILAHDISTEEWMLADADVLATMPAMAMALESKVDGETCKVLLWGFVRHDTWEWTIDDTVKILYASVTPGEMQEAAVSGSGDYSQAVAQIITADKILFCPTPVMAKHT